MKHTIRKSYLAMAILAAIWITVQIAVVCVMQRQPLSSDALRYVTLAADSAREGTMYPSPEIFGWIPEFNDHHPAYICYAGLINYFSLCLTIFGSWKSILWLNILLNCISAASIWKIARTLAGNKIAMFTAAIFMLSPQPVNLAALCMPEVPFMALTFASLALLCSRRFMAAAVAGILLAAACYIRSVAILFGISAVLGLLFLRCRMKQCAIYISSAALCVIAILAINRINTGHTFFSSTTLGVNMLIGANDACQGYYNNAPGVSDKIDSIAKGRNLFELNDIQRDHALEWIEKHPDKWAMLGFRKIFYQFKRPSFDYYISLGIADMSIPSERLIMTGLDYYSYLYQLLLYILALAGLIITCRRYMLKDLIVLLPLLGGIALSILTVGSPRYNVPYIPIFAYFASHACVRLSGIIANKKTNK